jgi:hypothetical protein
MYPTDFQVVVPDRCVLPRSSLAGTLHPRGGRRTVDSGARRNALSCCPVGACSARVCRGGRPVGLGACHRSAAEVCQVRYEPGVTGVVSPRRTGGGADQHGRLPHQVDSGPNNARLDQDRACNGELRIWDGRVLSDVDARRKNSRQCGCINGQFALAPPWWCWGFAPRYSVR